MSKLKNRYRIETDNFIIITGKNIEEKNGESSILYPFLNLPLGNKTRILSQLESFPQGKNPHKYTQYIMLAGFSIIVKALISIL